MGSSQSVSLTEVAVTIAVVAGAIGLGYKQLAPTPGDSDAAGSPSTTESTGKRSKKKKSTSAASSNPQPPLTTTVVPFPTVLPGGYNGTTTSENDVPESSKRSSKSKKKKSKPASSSVSALPDLAPAKAESGAESATPGKATGTKQDKHKHVTTQPSNTSPASRTIKHSMQSSTSVDTDGSWTRVESRRNRVNPSTDLATTSASEADPPTTATGSSSPVAERTDDDEYLLNSRNLPEARRPLAERVLPKPRKTGVESMLESPDHPTLSRVMRVLPEEKPAPGFNWGDYDDVRNDADGEGDDVGWDVVKSKRPQRTNASPSSSQTQTLPQKSSETLTKRQRQNANKRDAQKAAKAVAEEERLATLNKHKRELEKERMLEQQRTVGNKKVSGGMRASVDDRGKLVWE